MINLLKNIQRRFSVSKAKFDAAESVLKNFYDCGFDDKNKKVNTPSYILIDKIFADLQQLKDKSAEKNEKDAIENVMNMFRPNLGINLKEFVSNIQDRQ